MRRRQDLVNGMAQKPTRHENIIGTDQTGGCLSRCNIINVMLSAKNKSHERRNLAINLFDTWRSPSLGIFSNNFKQVSRCVLKTVLLTST